MLSGCQGRLRKQPFGTVKCQTDKVFDSTRLVVFTFPSFQVILAF